MHIYAKGWKKAEGWGDNEYTKGHVFSTISQKLFVLWDFLLADQTGQQTSLFYVGICQSSTFWLMHGYRTKRDSKKLLLFYLLSCYILAILC